MRLYYFTAEKWALTVLRECRLKLSTFDELNDPFELLGVSLGEKRTREVMHILQKHYAKKYGLLCFSDSWHSPLMWAHYADKHKGMCLGFDVDNETLFPMTYEDERAQLALDESKSALGINEADLLTLLKIKAKVWSYESEFRVMAKLEHKDSNGLYYVDFGDKLALREVIIGARCKTPIHMVAKQVYKQARSVEVFRARPAFERFEIVRQMKLRPVVIEPLTA